MLKTRVDNPILLDFHHSTLSLVLVQQSPICGNDHCFLSKLSLVPRFETLTPSILEQELIMLGALHQNQVATLKRVHSSCTFSILLHSGKGIALPRTPLVHDHKSVAFPRRGFVS
jgi:hypothetical protein